MVLGVRVPASCLASRGLSQLLKATLNSMPPSMTAYFLNDSIIMGVTPMHVHAQSCLTVCDPKDCSSLGSPVHGIFQARILEWVAISYYRGSSQSWDQTCLLYLLHWQVGSLPLAPPGNPISITFVLIYWLVERHNFYLPSKGGNYTRP